MKTATILYYLINRDSHDFHGRPTGEMVTVIIRVYYNFKIHKKSQSY